MEASEDHVIHHHYRYDSWGWDLGPRGVVVGKSIDLGIPWRVAPGTRYTYFPEDYTDIDHLKSRPDWSARREWLSNIEVAALSIIPRGIQITPWLPQKKKFD